MPFYKWKTEPLDYRLNFLKRVAWIYKDSGSQPFEQLALENKVTRQAELFGFVLFYGVSTLVGYSIPNPFHTYILNIYNLVWLGFMAYQPLLVI